MNSHQTWFDTAVCELTDPHHQRVWSIIVSLFGDLAQDRGAQISGAALTRIIEPIGIKPEAIRVALHRLRKDGWIESARTGRASLHYLTEFGRDQSARVTPRIYARSPVVPDNWHLLSAEEGVGISALDDLLLTRNYISVGRNAALGAGPVPKNCDDLLVFEVTASAVPAWLQSRVFPQELKEACSSLRTAVRHVHDTRPNTWKPSPAQIATLRTLIVHRWRRVVLRHPDLPPEFFPQDWTGSSCRKDVFRLLDALPRPDLAEINS